MKKRKIKITNEITILYVRVEERYMDYYMTKSILYKEHLSSKIRVKFLRFSILTIHITDYMDRLLMDYGFKVSNSV